MTMKEITIKKNQTLGELALGAIDAFEIKGIEIKNFRFRTYDPKIKVSMAIHDSFEKQLHKLNFISYMDLTIETKKDDEVFEMYDSDFLFIRVLKHVEGESYDFKNLDKLPA